MNAVYQMKQTLRKTLIAFSIVAFMWIALPGKAMAANKEQPCAVCTQAVLEIAAEESVQSIAIETWMVNDAFWNIGLQEDAMNRENVPLEAWMFTMGETLDFLPKQQMPVEEWMLDSYYWEVDANTSIAQSIMETVSVQDWMFENKFWAI